MRLLVACSNCRRQYDASKRPIGSRFRCLCGTRLQVEEPKGHDARVVRCSACGAARNDDSDICPYCKAEITLHERDLNTVCPQCLARVSDQARFCHHCGTALAPDLDAGDITEMRCPTCADGPALHSRKLAREKVAVLECERCGGLWLGHEAFRQLLERARTEALPPVVPKKAPGKPAAKDSGKRGARFYPPCLVCGELMNRVNYAHVSGVLLHICKDHGIWFREDALARILEWIHTGGAQKAAEKATHEAVREAARVRAERQASRAEWDQTGHPPNLLGTLLDVLFGSGSS